MRLRPNGDSGPLALSFDAMDHYFLTHGRDWERYALIKARPVAGDIEAGKALLETLSPFIYRKYLDFGAFDSIRSMKNLIERGLKRKDLKNDIIDSAAKIAMKKASAAEETRKLQAKANDPTRKQKNIQDYTRHFLRYRLDMTEQEFLNQVNGKLSNMVGDALNILASKLDDIPPQILA